MLSGLLALATFAPAQQPAPVVQPAPAAPPAVVGAPPSIDPCPAPAPPADDGFSFNTTHSGPPWTLWGGADYRMYWLKDAPSAGTLATVGTTPFGTANADFGRTNGVGFNLGGWLNDRHTIGLEARGLLLEQRDLTASVGGPATVRRPFVDAVSAAPANFAVNDPALGVSGRLATEQGIRLSGFEVNALNSLCYDCNWSADYVVGFRYLDLDEYLTFTQTSAVPGALGLPLAGRRLTTDAALSIQDRFRTRNQFYGGQVGLRGEYRAGGFFVSASSKVGIGNVHRSVDIDGRTDVAGVGSAHGGLLATPGANVGRFRTDRFGVLVDLGTTAGYQFAAWGRAFVGYDFLYLNDVSRPGLQVDQTVNTRFVPTSVNFNGQSGLRAPIPTGRTEDFFAHGLRFGLELMY